MPEQTPSSSPRAKVTITPDADPRNRDWLRTREQPAQSPRPTKPKPKRPKSAR